jgi:hypothetical protein
MGVGTAVIIAVILLAITIGLTSLAFAKPTK